MKIKEITKELMTEAFQEILKKYDLNDIVNGDFKEMGFVMDYPVKLNEEVEEDDLYTIIEEEIIEKFKDRSGMKEKIKEIKRKERKDKIERLRNE